MVRLVDGAVEFAGLGWPVLPVQPRGKVPLTEHGLKDATTDIDQIRSWWRQTPDANIGVRTDGLVVIDADGPIGKHQWLKFIGGIGFRDCPYQWTGGGGLHVVYRRDGLDIRNRAGWLRKVDIRASEGGYIVAGPSIHASGAPYWWEQYPSEFPPPAMPARLKDALTARPTVVPVDFTRKERSGLTKYGLAALDGEVEKVSHAPVGQRNQTLNNAAFSLGQLIGSGDLDVDAVCQRLMYAAAQCGLPYHEAEQTVMSGVRGGLTHQRKART